MRVESISELREATIYAASLHRRNLLIVYPAHLHEQIQGKKSNLLESHQLLNCYVSGLSSEIKRMEECRYMAQVIRFQYSCSYREWTDRKAKITEKINEIVRQAKLSGIEDWKKAYAVVRYCVNNWHYGRIENSTKLEYTAYSAIINNTAVCMGISLAICSIFKELGMRSWIIVIRELGRKSRLSRERNGTFFYICGANTNHKSGGKQCKGHRVRKEYVDDDVLRLIQTHMKTVLDTEKMIQEMNAASKNQTQYLLLDKEVGKLRRELSRISKRKSDLYEDYSERLITEEEYIQFSRIYSNEIENIKSRLDTVLAAQVRYSQDYHIEEGWGNVIHTYMSKRKLTKEMADAFVDSIIIHGKYDYEIKLVYDDQFADLQKLKKEKEAQSR